jgi:hypothetical protein
VRPNQGLIDEGGYAMVTVILQIKAAEEVLAGETLDADKFLVQSVDVADVFFANVSMKQQQVLPN